MGFRRGVVVVLGAVAVLATAASLTGMQQAAPPGLIEQRPNPFGHRRNPRQVVSGLPEQAVPVAEVVLDIDDQQRRRRRVEPVRQRQRPARRRGCHPLGSRPIAEAKPRP